MAWLLLSLAAPFLFAITNHVDKLLLERYFHNHRANTYLLFTSIASLICAAAIVAIDPAVFRVPFFDALIMLGAGAAYFLAIIPYIQALLRDEASRVVPLFQVMPVIAYGFGVVFFHEQLSLMQLVAGAVIMAGAVGMSIDIDNAKRLKKTVFGLMVLSSLLFVVESVLFKVVGEQHGFWTASFYQYIGTALAGIIMMVGSVRYRQDFFSVLKQGGWRVTVGSTINELINIGGRLCFNAALLLAPLAIVNLLLGVQPIFVLAIGTILTIIMPQIVKESLLRHHMTQKITATLVIFAGTVLLLF